MRLQRAVEHHRKNDQNRTKHHVYDGIPEQKNRLPFKKKLKLLNLRPYESFPVKATVSLAT